MRRVGAVKQEDLKVVDVNEDKEEIKNGKKCKSDRKAVGMCKCNRHEQQPFAAVP
jgi:hypothetical protein